MSKYFFILAICRLNGPCFSEIQLLNARRAALASVLPLSPENSQNNVPTPPHPADFHPAYRIPGYMELLYSLHNATSPPSSLHGKYFIIFNIKINRFFLNKIYTVHNLRNFQKIRSYFYFGVSTRVLFLQWQFNI